MAVVPMRRDFLECSARVLTQGGPFRPIQAGERAGIIPRRTLVVRFEPDTPINSLSDLLTRREDRTKAAETLCCMLRENEEMPPHALEMLRRFHKILDLPAVTGDIPEDDLEPDGATAAE